MIECTKIITYIQRGWKSGEIFTKQNQNKESNKQTNKQTKLGIEK